MSVDVKNFITWIRTFLDDVYAPKGQSGGITIDDVYPVGSIYMSANNTSPATLFGGTWEQIQGKFLLASSTSHTAGSTGGEETHTLSIDEMPSHTHNQNAHTHRANQDGSYKFVVSQSNINWVQTSKRNMSHTSGSYYYLYSSQSGGVGENTESASTTATNQNNGGGNAHNNMPPYLTVNVWKRTA